MNKHYIKKIKYFSEEIRKSALELKPENKQRIQILFDLAKLKTYIDALEK